MTELASFSARPVLLPICFAFFFLFHKAAIISKLHMGTVNPGMKRIGIIAMVFNNYNKVDVPVYGKYLREAVF